MAKRVLVTGAGGFLGVAVCRALAARGNRVTALDLGVGPALAALAAAHPAVEPVAADLMEWPGLVKAVEAARPDAVVHAAAVVGVPASVQAPMATLRVNVEGTMNLLETLRLFGVPRMVHVSTEEVYGPFGRPLIDEEHPTKPVLAYGISKLAVEQLTRSYGPRYGVEAIHVRTCWVYGPDLPRPRVPKTLVEAAVAGRPLHLAAGGDFRVDHTHVDDLVAGLLLALDHERHDFDTYHIASGTAPSLAEIVAVLRRLVPDADLSVGPGDYAFGPDVPAVRKGALDIGRARRALGYAPRYDIETGLADYVRALRERRAAAKIPEREN